MNRLNPIVSNWLISPTAFSNAVWAAASKKLFGLRGPLLSMILLCFCFSTVCAQHNWTRTHSDTHVDLSGALAQGIGYWITHLNGSWRRLICQPVVAKPRLPHPTHFPVLISYYMEKFPDI